MAIVSLPSDARQLGSLALRRADVAPVSTGHEADAPCATSHQIGPSFLIPVADSNSERTSGSLSPSVSNRMSAEEIARSGNIVGNRCAGRFQTDRCSPSRLWQNRIEPEHVWVSLLRAIIARDRRGVNYRASSVIRRGGLADRQHAYCS